jgi:hypothetical protein
MDGIKRFDRELVGREKIEKKNWNHRQFSLEEKINENCKSDIKRPKR